MIGTKARCRGCGRPIVWARHATTDRSMPFDAEPSTAGTWDLRERADRAGRLVAVHDPQAEPRYQSHWATCEQAERFRT